MALGTVMLRQPEQDYSTTRLSEQRLYTVTIKPEREPIPLNTIHM
jgi:hypothetical protein